MSPRPDASVSPLARWRKRQGDNAPVGVLTIAPAGQCDRYYVCRHHDGRGYAWGVACLHYSFMMYYTERITYQQTAEQQIWEDLMTEDIMALRVRFLHQEVKIVDGSNEDGEFGYVVGVTASSAEPITVLFYHMGEVKHQNYYRPEDVSLTGGDWKEGKQRDQTVRCRRSRFDGLFYAIDGKGPHGVGYGTTGGAWAAYLNKVGQEPGKEQSGEEAGSTAADSVDAEAAQVDSVAGPECGGELRHGVVVGERDDEANPGERDEAQETDRPDAGGVDRVGEARAD